MNFALASLAYIVMGILIGVGLLKAVTGSYVILLIGLVIFFGLFVKAGCLSSHD
jgi:hypothetical protein